MATPAQPSSSGSRGPTLQGRAWRSLLEAHRDLVRHLEHALRCEAGIELQHYDVLLHVSEGEHGRRMTDLADAVVLSKSGLTSLVDRMEAEGLVERRPDAEDRRGIRIHLTPAGEERLAAASLQHREIVRRIFTSKVTEAEARVIVEALERVRGELGGIGNPNAPFGQIRPARRIREGAEVVKRVRGFEGISVGMRGGSRGSPRPGGGG